MKLSKKHFGRIAFFSFKKFIGRSPKEFKEVFGQKHPNKNHTSFYWKNTTKRNIEKTMWQNRLVSKKYHYWRDVAIKCGFLCPFWSCREDLRSGKRVCILERKCGFPCLFGLVGGVCGAEKGHAFWSKSVDFYALFGLLGGGSGVEKGQAV